MQLPYLSIGLLAHTPQRRRIDVIVIADVAGREAGANSAIEAALEDSQAQGPNHQGSQMEQGQWQQQQQQQRAAEIPGVHLRWLAPSGRQARPVVVLTGRVHPGEVPASHVLQVRCMRRGLGGASMKLVAQLGARHPWCPA